MASGYTTEYMNKDWCGSIFLHPASWLISDRYLFAVSLLLILYLLIAVAVASNYMARAVRRIVYETKTVTIKLGHFDSICVERSTWNPTVTNMTLMALLAYSPMILLHLTD